MGEMVKQIAALQDYERYQDLHWEGSFEDYLQIVRERPQVTRNAFQRIYDMVVSYGEEEYIDNKKKLIRYPFFKDPIENGKDAIFGLDIPLMRLVHVLHAAAQGYGPEKRIILLHGPVGSSKSTIARLLKKGLERYSRTPEGALFTYEWVNLHQTGLAGGDDVFPCPMHDEPLRLIPPEWRNQAVQELRLGNDRQRVQVRGELNPACRFIFRSLLERYDGDWSKVMSNHIKVKRLVLERAGPRRHRNLPAQGRERTKIRRSSPVTSTTGRLPSTAPTPTPALSTSTASSTSQTAAWSSSSKCLKLDVAFLYDLLGARPRSTKSSRRSSLRPTSTR